MNLREFMASSLALADAASPVANAAQAAPAREFYELRLYHLRRGPMVKRFDDFCRDAAIPALNRAGIRPVGVFNVVFGPDNPTSYLLLPHASLESFASLESRLQADEEYLKAGADFLNASPTEPAYIRVESSLMVSFTGIPQLEVPAQAAEKRPRIFEMRTYEAHSKKANLKKIEMFNDGEIGIFRRTGLKPVFFGETLIGSKLPNLTYMLAFDNLAEREKNWAAFIADPEWKKLSATPGFTDPEILTNINSVILRPAPYSQI